MWWLAKLFSMGRVGPRKGDARPLALAPTQRSHLDLKEVAYGDGAVQLITGEWRAVSEVTGWPLHARDADEALSFLSQIATALNALPGRLVMLSRSRPGGLESYALERRARSQTEGGPLARLLRDQAEHATRRMAQGRYREHNHYLVTAGRSKEQALRLLNDTRARLEDAGVSTRVVKDNELAAAIAKSWRPASVEHFTVDFFSPRGDVLATLAYSPGRARGVLPRYVDPPRLPNSPHRSLPSTERKALRA